MRRDEWPRRRRLRTLWIGTSVAALLLLSALAMRRVGGVPATPDPDAGSFVTAHGTALLVNGKTYDFVGFNLYDAAATTRYRCASWPRFSDDDLDAALGYLHEHAGAKVLRFWAYQTYTAGGTDWSGIDRVVRLARKHGMRVLPVLEDGPGNCTTGPDNQAKSAYEGDTWFTEGYRVAYGTAQLSYRDYVTRVVAHYRDEPTILGWSMMNEAETKQRDPQGKSAIVGFAEDIGGLIKSVDPHHLVTVGTQGNGSPGSSGQDFRDIYDVPTVDFAEVHDWAYYGSDNEAMPGSAADGTLPAPDSGSCGGRDGTKIACAFAIAARVLQKPIVVGEAGIAASPEQLIHRADLLAAKMNAAFAAGASGYLVWQFNKVEDGENYDILQKAHDPLVPTMQRIASALP